MSDAERIYDEENTTFTGKIIDFPHKINNTSEQPFFVKAQVQNKIEDIKTMVESQVLELLANDFILTKNVINNPFDSIYLCDLKPDKVLDHDRRYLQELSLKIIDKSDDLSFNDGLDN